MRESKRIVPREGAGRVPAELLLTWALTHQLRGRAAVCPVPLERRVGRQTVTEAEWLKKW